MNFSLKHLFSKQPDNDKAIVPEPYNYFSNRPAHPFKAACYAPFKSLYFGHYGNVVACCQNRAHVLGVYPDQTIMEIWKGEKANELREALKQDRLNLGCGSCQTRIVSRNEKGLIATGYDLLPLDPEGYPTSFEFELSNICNLECIMCNGDFSSLIRAKQENRPPIAQAYDAAFIEQLKEFIPHLSKAVFFGGEPFLIEIYYSIWEEMARLNPSVNITVQTNGTVLSNRVKDLLERCNFHINISVDSVSEENYPKIRVNGDWKKTSENIKWFAAYCKRKNTSFGISTCPLQQNWHELVDIVQYANANGAKAFIHQVIAPRHTALRFLSKQELTNAYVVIQEQLKNYINDTELAQNNLQVLRDFLNETFYRIEQTPETPEIFNDIDTLFDFYSIFEKRLLADSKGFDGSKLLGRLKESLAGLEDRPELVSKFRQINLQDETTWQRVLTDMDKNDSTHIRYEIINHM